MIIYNNSRKGGFALGGNHLTKSNLIAGGVAAIGLALAAVIGLWKPKKNDKKAKSTKKKRLLDLAVLIPLALKLTKSAVSKIELDKIVTNISEAIKEEDESCDIEVIDAIPISSEEEVYEYIQENNL